MTRARAQASALAERLRGLGAEVVEAPAIRTRALEVELPAIGDYDLLCVTSPTGADRLFDHLRDARELAGRHRRGDRPGHRPRPARARRRGRRRARARGGRGARRGARGRPVRARADRPRRRGPRRADRRAALARRDRGRGGALRDRRRSRSTTRRVPVPPPPTTCSSPPPRRCASSPPPEASCAARGWSRSGPATSAELRAHGAEPDLEADPHTPDGLIAALLADAVSSTA